MILLWHAEPPGEFTTRHTARIFFFESLALATSFRSFCIDFAPICWSNTNLAIIGFFLKIEQF